MDRGNILLETEEGAAHTVIARDLPSLPPSADFDGRPTTEEIVALGAVDTAFFGTTFFPQTIRQATPTFHAEIDSLLDDPGNRLLNIQVFRGGAKTTKLRIYTAKRIAYGLAHTILYIGKSEGHAIRSVRWLKNQILRNSLYTGVFGLSQGKKWQDIEIEIEHGVDQYPIWVMGMGITGSVRGINQDDFRPDLIIVDDVVDEENSATPDQRIKINNLIHGALKESLSPATETPDAKLALLQTPLNREDASSALLDDPEWVSAVFGCWTDASDGMPLEAQESRWPERYPTETLRKEKLAAIGRNRLSLWMREKECKITSPETSSFQPQWLKFYDVPPEKMVKVLAIDPVPPPSELQIAKGLRGKNWEVFAVVGMHKGECFLLKYEMNRGHEPNWTIAKFFELCMKYHPREIVIEATGYQRTLSWLLKTAMDQRRQYWAIREIDERRSKFDRIVDALNGPASEGKLYVRAEHFQFIQQFNEYPDVTDDDVIEAVAVAVDTLMSGGILEGDFSEILDEEADIPELYYGRGAP